MPPDATAFLSPYADPHPLAQTRAVLLAAALPHVVFDGWSKPTLEQAAQDAGIDADALAAAFPQQGLDLLALFLRHGDAATAAAIAGLPLPSLKVRQRIEAAVMARLLWALPHREAVRRGLAALSFPPHAGLAMQSVYDTVDTIWHAIGDRSTDMNFYSKRALLAGVYGTTLVVWLDDASDDLSITRRFLQRRIGDVMRIETAKQKMRAFRNRWMPGSPAASTRPMGSAGSPARPRF